MVGWVGVKALGVYFRNDDTSEKTFSDIIPKIKRSMSYWKQFELCEFAKARVTEIFHASRLWYASTFYPIPNKMKTDLQASFKEYINFPRRPTVSETEMKKLRTDGGIKLVDIQTRIDTSRCMWLLNLVHNPELKASLAVMSRLVGMQKGGLIGPELIFTDIRYSRLLRIPNSMFYLQGLKAAAKLTLNKRIDDLNEEKFSIILLLGMKIYTRFLLSKGANDIRYTHTVRLLRNMLGSPMVCLI